MRGCFSRVYVDKKTLRSSSNITLQFIVRLRHRGMVCNATRNLVYDIVETLSRHIVAWCVLGYDLQIRHNRPRIGMLRSNTSTSDADRS